MSDLISRTAAIDALYHHFPHMSREECAAILHEVGDVETEIIRCEDCRHWMDIDNGRQKHFMCGQVGMGNWYCADAKRREDGRSD